MFALISIAGAVLLSWWGAFTAGAVAETAAEAWPGVTARTRATFAAVIVAWAVGLAGGWYARSAVPYWPGDLHPIIAVDAP